MELTRPNYLDHPILGLLALAAIATNFASLLFTIYRLKVHKHIKILLLWGIAQNLIGSVLELIGYTIMVLAPSNMLLACALFSIPLQQCLCGGHVMTSAIGIIRYYVDCWVGCFDLFHFDSKTRRELSNFRQLEQNEFAIFFAKWLQI